MKTVIGKRIPGTNTAVTQLVAARRNGGAETSNEHSNENRLDRQHLDGTEIAFVATKKKSCQ